MMKFQYNLVKLEGLMRDTYEQFVSGLMEKMIRNVSKSR